MCSIFRSQATFIATTLQQLIKLAIFIKTDMNIKEFLVNLVSIQVPPTIIPTQHSIEMKKRELKVEKLEHELKQLKLDRTRKNVKKKK